MAAKQPTILATSGGYVEGRRTRLEFGPLFHHAVELAGVDGRAPKVTFVGTASGDPRSWAAEIDDAARIVGFDLVEVAPGEDEWDPNVGARLLYKLIGVALMTRRS